MSREIVAKASETFSLAAPASVSFHSGGEDERRGWIRARQIAAFHQLLPAVAVANSANALLLIAAFWRSTHIGFVLCWGILVACVSSWPVIAKHRAQRPEPQVRSPRSIRRVLRASSILACLWATLLACVFPVATTSQQVLLAVVAVGMMCGGSFMLATVSVAARGFSTIVYVGICVGLLRAGTPDGRVLVSLLFSYNGVLWFSSAWIQGLFVRQLLAESEAREKSGVIGLLLNEYEQGASDWLWRLDREGKLVSPSPRFEAALHAAGSLEGCVMVDLLRPGPELEALRTAIASGLPFRDIEVPVAGSGAEIWLSLSGQALINSCGDKGHRGVASDITAVKAASAQVSFLAHNDPLTRLPNRLSITVQLEHQLRSEPRPSGGGLIFVDLDEFKTINDSLGHQAGDDLLCAAAARLRSCTPSSAMVGRLGGDEFALVLPAEILPELVEQVAQDVVSAMRAPFELSDRQVFSGCSVGLRLFQPHDHDPALVLKHADLALYAAKADGKGVVRTFTTSMETKLREHTEMEAGLRRALLADELRLHFQPFVDSTTGALVGCEALVRWQHPALGLILPGRFLEDAARAGLMDDLGMWVLRAALRDLRQLPEPLVMAVNVSATQLKNPQFFRQTLAALAESGVAAERLEIEITESALFDGTGFVLQTLEQLAAAGIRIALDDFGTGYSSLSHLRLFPFNKIKIDKSFVDGLVQRDDCRAIVSAVCSLANSLGMTTTAEGVETPSQLDQVRSAGCTYIQGYLYSRPVTLADVLGQSWMPPVEEFQPLSVRPDSLRQYG